LRIVRVFAAPRDKVFRAWSDPVELAKWFGPKGMTVPVCEMDVRAGGVFRACMRSADGDEHCVRGVYREVVAPQRIVFTWCWEQGELEGLETLVTIELRDQGQATELVLTHQGFPSAEAREAHNQGWSSSFECLDEII